MGENEKKPWWDIWESDAQRSGESSGKVAHDAKRHEKGVGNRKPDGPPEAKNGREFNAGPLVKLNTAAQGALVDSRLEKGADQKSFYQVMQGKVGDLELASASVNLTESKIRVVAAKGKAEGSVIHAELDLVDKLTKWLFGDDGAECRPHPPPSSPMPGAARLSDFVAHVGALFPGTGSDDVFIDGLPAWRAGVDLHFCTAAGSPHGVGTVATPTQTTVLINGFPAARAGDLIVEATGGLNMIVVGSPTVFVGSPAPPPAPATPVCGALEPPSVTMEAVAKADVIAGEAAVDGYAEVDLHKGKAIAEGQAGVVAALLKGELPIKVKIPIPGTEYAVGLGVTFEGTLVSGGMEAGAGMALNDGKKAFGFTWGAKAGYGLGGAGVKFGLDISK